MKTKKIILVAFTIILIGMTQAQVPQGIPYQASARNSAGGPLTNQLVKIRFSILDSVVNGIVVYKETHLTTTNSLGLFNVNIGKGTPIINVFSSIFWNKNNKFLKVELDVSGLGNTYIDMGTQQMMSVPYSLYSETTKTPGFTHYIGELFGGGIIFNLYKDENGLEHGLIVSMIDIGGLSTWSNINNSIIGLNSQSDWNGSTNTAAIIAQSGHTNSAAKLCDDYTNNNYSTGIYSDWYLPSIFESTKIYNSLLEINKSLELDANPNTTLILKTYYWTSTEIDDNTAYCVNFASGSTNYSHYYNNYSYTFANYYTLKLNTYKVRPIRSF
jgi:hypothetical protein